MATNPATSAFDLADAVGLISTYILSYRVKNKANLTDNQIDQLENAEISLDELTAQLRAAGIDDLAALTDAARQEVIDATTEADKFLAKLKSIEKAMSAVTALLGLGLAVMGGKPQEIFTAAKTLKKAVG